MSSFVAIGDLIANLTGSLILLSAAEYRLPKVVLLRMGVNIAVNTILGAVPIFGDIISIWFRSNVKNVELLERYAGRESRRAALGDWVFVIVLIFGLFVVLAGIVLAVAWLLKKVWNIL